MASNPYDQVQEEEQALLMTPGDASPILPDRKSKKLEDLPEETILSLEDSMGNTALHLLFKHANRTAIKYVLQTAMNQYQIPVEHLLNKVNKSGRKPEDMSCEPTLKSEIKTFVQRLISQGPRGNSLISSHHRSGRFQKKDDL